MTPRLAFVSFYFLKACLPEAPKAVPELEQAAEWSADDSGGWTVHAKDAVRTFPINHWLSWEHNNISVQHYKLFPGLDISSSFWLHNCVRGTKWDIFV